jgi:hypothetical protein
VADDLPPLVTRFLGDISNLRAAVAEGTVLVKGFRDDAQSSLTGGKELGAQFGKDLGDGIHDAIPASARPAEVGDQIGKQVADGAVGRLRDERPLFASAGQGIGDGLKQGVKDALPKSLADLIAPTPSDAPGPKGDGKRTGQAFAGGMSPLILGAFAAAGTVGPAAILAGVATAVIGAGALVTKGNTQLQESYAQLGQKASAAITQASAPLIPALYSSVQVLEQGVARIGPELKGTFAAVAPDVTEITSGFVSLVGNTLPGLNSGLRSIAPYTHDIAIDIGKLGSGAGGFFAGLGSGAGGATTGFNALIDDVDTLLVDAGKLTGALSNGLGPALHDISNVAIPVVNAFTDVIDALPPRSIEAAAVATTALFAAFKIGSLTGLVAEGATFLGFLTSARIGEVALTAETETTSLAMRGMGLAMDAALGPLGLIAAGMTLFGLQSTFATGKMQDLIGKVQSAVNAQKTQKQATDDATQAQAQATAATIAANTSLSGQQQLLTQSAVSAGNSAVTALSFAGAQDELNGKLATTISDFSLASGASSAYKTALDALYGKYQSYSDAQATFTIDLDNAAKGLKSGKDGFDQNTTAGAANYRVMSALFTAGENRAGALLKETGNQQLANQSLQQAVTALDNTARQAHFTQGQIDALNIALTGTKNIGSIQVPISADTQPAIDAVGRLVRYIDGQAAYVQVGASTASSGGKQTHVTVGGHQLLDLGGRVNGPPGAPADATVHGGEYVLSQNMLAGRAPVDASVLAALRSGPSVGSGRPPTVAQAPPVGYGAAGAAQVPVVNVYIDGRLVTGGVRSSALQYKTRNSQTAFN